MDRLTNNTHKIIPHRHNERVDHLFDSYQLKLNKLYLELSDHCAEKLAETYFTEEELKREVERYDVFYGEYTNYTHSIRSIYRDPKASLWDRVLNEYQFSLVVTNPTLRGTLLVENYLETGRIQDLKRYAQDAEVGLLNYLYQLYDDWVKLKETFN